MSEAAGIYMTLRGGAWDGLIRLITHPDGKHESGGWQNRKRKWRGQISEADKSITLDPDDVDFIRRQLMNRKGGGWQKQMADIFAGRHPQFTRLPVTPRKKRL